MVRTDRPRKGWPRKNRNSERRGANQFEIHFGFLRWIRIREEYHRKPLPGFPKYF
jgi:hypothetical protein